MASLQAVADSVRDSASSASTCTSETVVTLNNLLLPKLSSQNPNIPITAKATRSTRATKPKSTKAPVKPQSKKVEQENITEHEEEHLSPKERSILATEVINATLKSLSESIKNPVPSRRKGSAKETVKASERRALRRSNSLPQTPLQPRSLNRVSSTPDIATRLERSSSSVSLTATGQRSVAECSRVAFACLRAMTATKSTGIDLPPLQIENGMSVLIGKLISLGLEDLAIKEIRILKRRLDPEEIAIKKTVLKATTSVSASPTLAEMLNFGKGALVGAKLGLVITTQLQILRLMVSSPKKLDANMSVRLLQPSSHCSPTKLLLLVAKESKSDKIARQLQSLSEILLSLTPSISSADDTLATNIEHSIAPRVAIQLQTLALYNRVLWWKFARHRGDPGKELFDPFLRCLSAFARRSEGDALETYHLASTAYTDLQTIFTSSFETQHDEPKEFLGGIFRLLSSLSKKANLVDQAIDWVEKCQAFINPATDSDVRQCSATARLLALHLQRLSDHAKDENALLSLLDKLENPFKGHQSEIEELLTEISDLRRVAITILAKRGSEDDYFTDSLREMCQNLVLMCPKLSLRYLGNPPGSNSSTKEILGFEQRRRFIRRSAMHAIDSSLFLLRTFINSSKVSWDSIDARLQECLSLEERINPTFEEVVPSDGLSSQSYHVKISNLYFTKHLNMIRDSEKPNLQLIQALKRSIDCVSSRSILERKTAQISVKLEKMADIYKSIGRYDELFKTLISLRDECISNGALKSIAENAGSQPISVSWSQTGDAILLARTIQYLVKVQFKCLIPESQKLLYDGPWSEEEKGAILEHILDILSTQENTSKAFIAFQAKIFQAALTIYDRKLYPVRRLRVLRHLVSLDHMQQQEVTANFTEELQLLHENFTIEGSRDEGLYGYLAHYNLLMMSLLELKNKHSSVEVIKNCIGIWSSTQERCKDLASLELEIDDIAHLLVHLQSLADFLQMKGFNMLVVSVLRLIADLNEFQSPSSNPNALAISFTRLGTQWLDLGYSGKAGLAFDKAESYGNQLGVSLTTLLQLYLAYSEYFLVIGNSSKSEEYLLRAQVCYSRNSDYASDGKNSMTLQERRLQDQLIAKAYLLYSRLAMQRGSTQSALTHAKLSVKLLRRTWALTERLCRNNLKSFDPDVERSATDMSAFNESISTVSTDTVNDRPLVCGAGFWVLITPLFKGLTHLSTLYAHNGMFPETIYYAEQAHQLVRDMRSELHIAVASALLGSWWLKAGVLDKGSEYLVEAKKLYASSERSRETAILAMHLASMHNRLGDHSAKTAAYEDAKATLTFITKPSFINSLDRASNCSSTAMNDSTHDLNIEMSELTVSKKKVLPTRKISIKSRAPSKAKLDSQVKACSDVHPSISEECSQLLSLQGSILRRQAHAFMLEKSFVDSQTVLREAGQYFGSQIDTVEHGLLMAKQLLLQSIEQMNADPVYSILQESTISFPSVIGQIKSDKSSADRLSVRVSPGRKGQTARSGRNLARTKSPAPDSFFDKLRQAQEQLADVYSIALLAAPLHLVHSISALINSVAILLSTAGQINGKSLAHPGLASCSTESTRNLAIDRERKAILGDSLTRSSTDETCWPSLGSPDLKRLSLGNTHDMSQFQKDYIDIIPKNWTAISISLSENRSELFVTKFQAGQSPFVLRLPTERNNSIDADEEKFDFEQGHSELLEIIRLANESAHDARDMSSSGAKAAWWEEREALDTRLRDLLENIERVWLGGFTGIFTQHAKRPDLLARFQKSFQNILDKHLPSRQRNNKRGASSRITLDSRILELFIGLGDASSEECELSEPLTDLLYFVVDVLQFHGELNAYAEIDFDSIVIETLDALRGYHDAARSSASHDAEGKHAILILDKALHAFPWESLPCMDGMAVSRLNSLASLRERILAQQKGVSDAAPYGHYITQENGSYILNPNGDLKSTQATFSKPLKELAGWTGIVKREPTEQEMKNSLESSELFLYFGHGSGAQYIRAREIRKLDKCAVTVLMGCSSGALTEAGEFEVHGTPAHYMQAGCPALVGILWDVTDKDIDRFAKSTFEHWGLYDAKSAAAGKGKGKKKFTDEEEERVKMSLVEAVTEGRKACNLRYLTAAAVCVYGVPVYFT